MTGGRLRRYGSTGVSPPAIHSAAAHGIAADRVTVIPSTVPTERSEVHPGTTTDDDAGPLRVG